MNISTFVDSLIEPEVVKAKKGFRSPREEVIPLMVDYKTGKKFEEKVFNHFVSNRDQLDVKHVYQFRNCMLDGQLECSNGEIIGLEMKSVMNWSEASKAGWQFQRYMERHSKKFGNLASGIVIFEIFRGEGWDKKSPKRSRLTGWNYWYSGHCKIVDLKIHLLQFSNENLINADGKVVCC